MANFVIIMTDTQGANMVGCYGRPELKTPCIDALAAEGIRFDRAYTSSPVCTPARSGLFTGIYPHSNGAWGNDMPLGNTIHTLGQRFEDLGYHTGYIGKWHLSGQDYFDTGIPAPGWDPAYWFDGRNYLAELSDREIALWRNGLGSLEALKAEGVTAEFTWAHRITDRAIRFIEAVDQSADPFLLVVSYDEPHHPCTCPPEYVEAFLDFEYDVGPGIRDDLSNKPAYHREWAESEQGELSTKTSLKNPLLFGCNAFVDHEIGRVIDAVKQTADEDTWIIYTSDHGDMFGAHHLCGKGPAMYEEIVHIPLIVRAPNGVGGGRVDAGLASHIDLLPTLLEQAGAAVPQALQGSSLCARLEGEASDPGRGLMVEFNRYEVGHDTFGFNPIRCWLEGPWKLSIHLLAETDELYNLSDDPHELHNLIDDPGTAEIRDRLHDRLLGHMDEGLDPFRDPAWERRRWRDGRSRSWCGPWRPYAPDGYRPDVLDYRTGKLNQGVRTN